MRLLIACFLVGGVLAGKTNFYPSSHFPHFFRSPAFGLACRLQVLLRIFPELHFIDFFNAKKGGILFTHHEAPRCKSSPVLRTLHVMLGFVHL